MVEATPEIPLNHSVEPGDSPNDKDCCAKYMDGAVAAEDKSWHCPECNQRWVLLSGVTER